MHGENIYSLSNFQMHYTALLSIVTMLNISSLKLIHLKTENLYPLANIFTFVPFPRPWQPLFHSVSRSLSLLDSTDRRDHTVFVFDLLYLA